MTTQATSVTLSVFKHEAKAVSTQATSVSSYIYSHRDPPTKSQRRNMSCDMRLTWHGLCLHKANDFVHCRQNDNSLVIPTSTVTNDNSLVIPTSTVTNASIAQIFLFMSKWSKLRWDVLEWTYLVLEPRSLQLLFVLAYTEILYMYLVVIRSSPTAYSTVTIRHNHLNRKNIIRNQKYMCKII
jgi:hypothetical protein